MVSKEISDLRDVIAAMDRDLLAAKNRLKDLEIEECPIKMGMLMRRADTRWHGATKVKFEERARVIGFSRGWRGGVTPLLRLLKKNGADSLKTRPMYDYENWEQEHA